MADETRRVISDAHSCTIRNARLVVVCDACCQCSCVEEDSLMESASVFTTLRGAVLAHESASYLWIYTKRFVSSLGTHSSGSDKADVYRPQSST